MSVRFRSMHLVGSTRHGFCAEWNGQDLLVVRVQLSPLRPHRSRLGNRPPTVYVRLGSTNRETDPQLINQLQREAESASFDESPVVHLSATDVDLDHVMHFI
jgi:predicted HTH transcriptional regulator